MNIALFPGSFDPFTIGHADIVNRALPLFDEIIIAIGKNHDKQNLFPLDERTDRLKRYYANQPKIKVITYEGLTADIAQTYHANCILRGVRSVADFEYERNMAEANKQLCGIETILLYTSPALAHISSSLVRDLHSHKVNIEKYII